MRSNWPSLGVIIVILSLVGCMPSAPRLSGVAIFNIYSGSPISPRSVSVLVNNGKLESSYGFSAIARRNAAVVVRIKRSPGMRQSQWLLGGKALPVPASCRDRALPQLALSASGRLLACIGAGEQPKIYIGVLNNNRFYSRAVLSRKIVTDASVALAFQGNQRIMFFIPAGNECDFTRSLSAPSRIMQYDLLSQTFSTGPCANYALPFGKDGIALIRYLNRAEAYSTDWGHTWSVGNVIAFWDNEPVRATNDRPFTYDATSFPGTLLRIGQSQFHLPGQAISATWSCAC